MIPDIEFQLRVIVKSMKDNVLPALDSSNALALQQAGLSVATLENILQNFSSMHNAIRKDIKIHVDLAKKLQGIVNNKTEIDKLSAMLILADQHLNDPSNGIHDLQLVARDLRSEIGAVIRSNKNIEIENIIMAEVLEHSERSLLLGRAFNKLMGFEPNSELVPDLKELV